MSRTADELKKDQTVSKRAFTRIANLQGQVRVGRWVRRAHKKSRESLGGLEGYEFLLAHLQELTKAAKESFGRWKRWAPPEQKQDIQDRLKDLNQKIPVLVSRKADFISEAERGATSSHPHLPTSTCACRQTEANCFSQVYWQQA